MVANVIFRMGGAAALLSNRRAWSGRAKYELLHNVRTHIGADDGAYGCAAGRRSAVCCCCCCCHVHASMF